MNIKRLMVFMYACLFKRLCGVSFYVMFRKTVGLESEF